MKNLEAIWNYVWENGMDVMAAGLYVSMIGTTVVASLLILVVLAVTVSLSPLRLVRRIAKLKGGARIVLALAVMSASGILVIVPLTVTIGLALGVKPSMELSSFIWAGVAAMIALILIYVYVPLQLSQQAGGYMQKPSVSLDGLEERLALSVYDQDVTEEIQPITDDFSRYTPDFHPVAVRP